MAKEVESQKTQESASTEEHHTPITGVQYEQEPDFAYVENKNKDYYYYHGEANGREIQRLKRAGYEVVNSTTSSDKESAALQERGVDTTICLAVPGADEAIPEHILMRTPMKNREKILQARSQRDQELKRTLDTNIKNLSRALERGGVGSIKHFLKELDR